jgi:hypothetical protein
MKIELFEASDGKIKQILINNDSVKIAIEDWRGDAWELLFHESVALEDFSIVNQDLDRIEVSNFDSYIHKSCRISEDNPADFKLYSFYVAWGGVVRLRVVATDCLISGPYGADNSPTE